MFWISASIFFIFSCRTLPELSYLNIVDVLPPESNLIMKIAVPGNEALLETLMLQFGIRPGDLPGLSERMELLAVGLEVDSSLEGRRANWAPFHVVAIGDWPKTIFGEILGEQWVKSGRNRWLGPADFEIMLISKRELIISSGKLNSMLVRTRIASKNMEVASLGMNTENVDLAFWLAGPDLIHKILPALPVREFTGDVIVDLLGGAIDKVGGDAYSLDLSIHLAKPHFAESMALAMRLGFASQLSETFDFLNYELLSGLSIEAREPGIVINHRSFPIDLLENFLSLDFGLGVTGFDSGN